MTLRLNQASPTPASVVPGADTRVCVLRLAEVPWKRDREGASCSTVRCTPAERDERTTSAIERATKWEGKRPAATHSPLNQTHAPSRQFTDSSPCCREGSRIPVLRKCPT